MAIGETAAGAGVIEAAIGEVIEAADIKTIDGRKFPCRFRNW